MKQKTNKLAQFKQWILSIVIGRFYHNVNWKVVILLTVVMNLCTVFDGDWFNLKMNIGMGFLVIGAAFYD